MESSYGAFGSWAGRNQQGSYMETTVRWKGFNFPAMDNPRGQMPNSSDAMVPWGNQGFGMRPPEFPHHDRLSFCSDFPFSTGGNAGFDRNTGWQNEMENSFWEGPMTPHQNFSGPYGQRGSRMSNYMKSKKKKKKSYVQANTVSSVDVAKGKNVKTKAPQQPNKTASQAAKPAKPVVTAQKTAAQNGDTKKSETAQKSDDVNNQPNKKLKPVETTTSAEQTTSDNKLGNELYENSFPSIKFSCTLCRFYTEDEIELQIHFNTTRHRETIKYLYIFLPNKRVDFIQEYLLYQKRKVSQEQQRRNLQPIRDSFQGIGQEHFFHRIEVAQCLACDVLIPDVPQLLSQHITSEGHAQNCKIANKDIRSNCIMAAKTILKDKKVLKLLDKYNKGQNPFTDTAEYAPSQPGAPTSEILVAEEDDDHVVIDEDCYDDEVDNDHDGDPAPNSEVPEHDILPPSDPENKESDLPHEDDVFITLDIDGIVEEEEEEEEEEEAAEAP
ncbi:uncharacterized protein LOC142151383 isoform X2 [Mixophyes fleayi]|uniref:uncharacterized protein LOC142151383 isoform X2 n=1 Tax=Mixophyes fleayi TaxID=3061075 RepID=UPI003F4D8BC9